METEGVSFMRLFELEGRPMRVDHSMYEMIKNRLESLDFGSTISFMIHSEGGDLKWAREICALLHKASLQKNITTIGFAYGDVYSAALRIFLACQYRLGLPTVRYLAHLPKDNLSEFNEDEVYRIGSEEIDFFAAMTGESQKSTQILFSEGNHVNAKQAQQLGITNLSDYQRKQKPSDRIM